MEEIVFSVPRLESDQELLRNRARQVADDNIFTLGALVGHGSFFVTTKNATYIPEPPMGQSQTVVLRTDHLYGADDPIQWPQFTDGKNIHLHCIPSRPEDPLHPHYRDQVMWSRGNLDANSVRSITNGMVGGLAVLSYSLLEDLGCSVARLYEKMDKASCRSILDVPERRRYTDRLMGVINELLLILRRVPSSPSQLRQRLNELQRAWLYLQGWVNYLMIYRHRMRGREPAVTQVDKVIGFFTLDPELLATAKLAGIPAWLVQPTCAFTLQKKALVAKPILIEDSLVLANREPPVPAIYCGQNGTPAHITSIYNAARAFFSGEIADVSFDAQPHTLPATSPPIADQPSSSGAVRSLKTSARSSPLGSKSKQANRSGREPVKPQPPERDKYAEYTADFAPPPANEAWKGANQTIRRWRDEEKLPKTKGSPYLLPDPGLIFGCMDDFRRDCYLRQWQHMKDFWPLNARSPSRHVRDRLLLTPQQCAQRELMNVRTLLETCIKESGGDLTVTSIHPFGGNHPRDQGRLTKEECQTLLWELCQLSFQSELYYLHRRFCPPPPIDSSSLDDTLDFLGRLKGCVLACLVPGTVDIWSVDIKQAGFGLADPRWHERFKFLKAFHTVLCQWPGSKPRHFYDVPNEEKGTSRERDAWERAQVSFYAQSYYDEYNRPPILPRTLYNNTTPR